MTFKAQRNYPKKPDGYYRYKVVVRLGKGVWQSQVFPTRYTRGVPTIARDRKHPVQTSKGNKSGIYVYTHIRHAREQMDMRNRRFRRSKRMRALPKRLKLKKYVIIKVRCKGFRAGTKRYDRNKKFEGCLERWSEVTPVCEVV